MPLIILDKVSLAFGHVPLLDHADLQIERGERVALVGRNGTGKSSLLKVIGGAVHADDGSVWREPGLRLAELAQEVPLAEARSAYEVVADGLGSLGKQVADYHQMALRVAAGGSPDDVDRLSELQHELEAQDGWRLEQRVETILTRLALPTDQRMSELSGGAKRRVLLAQALVGEPDLLLLDEPTNHLDVDAIAWMEEFLLSFQGGLLFVTHDRRFLQRLATRIIELDRGALTSWPGSYQDYLTRKADQLRVEEEQNARFDKKLAQEEVWIRQGIKARRTRNEGRVRALEALRRQRGERRGQIGQAKLALDRGDSSGKIVLEAENVSLAYGGRTLIDNFSTRILRGDRVGLIGPNGAGKSSLLKILLGELQPDTGCVRLGTRLQVAYFDQQREQLDLERSVIDNIGDGQERVIINGESRHAISYLRDFLFPPERAQSPVKSLSGGERNRLLLARLFTRPANLLVLDEPTNDLDIETLELLEELLLQYDGTLLVVSHDRAFVDNVVTSTLVFEGEGKVNEYVGGYEDWLRQRRVIHAAPMPKTADGNQAANKARNEAPKPAKAAKLSYKDQRELEALPGRIEVLEQEQARLQQRINEPEFYRGDNAAVATTLERLEAIESELLDAYSRWEALDR